MRFAVLGSGVECRASRAAPPFHLPRRFAQEPVEVATRSIAPAADSCAPARAASGLRNDVTESSRGRLAVTAAQIWLMVPGGTRPANSTLKWRPGVGPSISRSAKPASTTITGPRLTSSAATLTSIIIIITTTRLRNLDTTTSCRTAFQFLLHLFPTKK